MEIFKFNILPMEEVEKRKAYREAVNNCPICGAQMQFKYDTDYLSNQIKEHANCESCKLEIRQEDYHLQ